MKKIDASDSFVGYVYEAYFALSLLLKSNENTEIALEKFDDVSLIKDEQIIVGIETKHHKDDKGKLTNSSTDFWNTLGNWSEAYFEKKLRPQDTMLMIITTQKISDSSVLTNLRPENRDTASVLKKINEIAKKIDVSHEKHYDKFNKLDDYQKFSLLDNIYIIDTYPKINEIKKAIISSLDYSVIPNRINDLYDELLGWWWGEVLLRLTGQISRNISKNEVREKILDISRKYTNDNLPIYFDESAISDKDLPNDDRTFVKQLDWISVGDNTKRHCKSDFYLASEHRSKWIRNELIFFDELKKFDNLLRTEWERRFDEMEESLDNNSHDNTKKSRGRELLQWANYGTDALCIRPLCKSPFVRRGTFQILSDKEEIGWHPDYKTKISKMDKNESNE
ncbi:ABC-three component system protein [Nitrosopumilus sp. SJ]|uniref:ABC-three component system protein n=1 Tax=Nitrosopumilus sp. SJ TaxID=1027374 RepID=UPI0012EA9C2E|nr:ABC-three component system protein [Nitrosopumilus sp. SJ]